MPRKPIANHGQRGASALGLEEVRQDLVIKSPAASLSSKPTLSTWPPQQTQRETTTRSTSASLPSFRSGIIAAFFLPSPSWLPRGYLRQSGPKQARCLLLSSLAFPIPCSLVSLAVIGSLRPKGRANPTAGRASIGCSTAWDRMRIHGRVCGSAEGGSNHSRARRTCITASFPLKMICLFCQFVAGSETRWTRKER